MILIIINKKVFCEHILCNTISYIGYYLQLHATLSTLCKVCSLFFHDQVTDFPVALHKMAYLHNYLYKSMSMNNF